MEKNIYFTFFHTSLSFFFLLEISQSKRLPKSMPLLSMKEKPRVEFTLVLFSPNILFLSKSVLSKCAQLSGSQDLPNHKMPGQTCATVNNRFTLLKTLCQLLMCITAHPST